MGQVRGWTSPTWLCTPEVNVLWHQNTFRMSSSFFQEPFLSSNPRSFIPKDLRGRESEGGVWSFQEHCVPSLEVWRELTRSMGFPRTHPLSPHLSFSPWHKACFSPTYRPKSHLLPTPHSQIPASSRHQSMDSTPSSHVTLRTSAVALSC